MEDDSKRQLRISRMITHHHRQRYSALSLAFDMQAFFREMAEQYRSATCVISRAKGTTRGELASAGLLAIIVLLTTTCVLTPA